MEVRRANRLRLRGEHEEARALLRRAADAARSVGDAGVEADARATLGYDRAVFGDEAALAGLYEALALATEGDAGEIVTKLLVNITNSLVFMGRFEEAAQLSIDGVSIAERYGLLALHGILLQGNGLQAMEALGRWDEAEAIVADILRRNGDDSVHRWASAMVGWGQIEIHRGEHASAARLYQRGFELIASGYYSGDLGQLGTGLIELAAVGAVPPVDVELVDSWVHAIPADEASWAARLVAVAAGHLVPRAGSADHEPVAATVGRWIDHVRCMVDEAYEQVPRGLDLWLEHARVELAEAGGERSPAAWSRLAAAWEQLSCPYFAARARFREADAALTAGGGRSADDRAAAAASMRAALRVADELRAEPLRRDVLDLATRARLRLDDGPTPAATAPVQPLPFGLTARELEVLHLLIEGHSNGEIGTRLFISRKTASVHVSNILRKLGATNRIEATAIARRHQV
jgi:DNA-binding CsgD family transcriptional regulator/tetratricopeptide (TPR) repeat protein